VGLTDTCFVQTTGRAFLLYAWRMDLPAAQEACQSALAHLNEAPSGEGVERLLERWSSPDLVVILTGTGPWTTSRFSEEAATPITGDAWLDGMRALYDGQVSTSLTRLEHGLEAQPARKVLSQTAALVALLDKQPERAAFDARAGLLYHPTDPLLRYCESLALCRLGRFGEAESKLRESRREGGDKPLLLLQLLLYLRVGEWWSALGLWFRLRSEPRFVGRARWMIAGWGILSGSLLVLALCLCGGAWEMLGGGSAGIAAILLSLAMLLLLPAPRLLRRFAEKTLAGKNPKMLLVSPELFPRERRGEPAH
jgi:hypothetical protein